MGGTLKDVMDELTPERRARIEARADEIYREYMRLRMPLHRKAGRKNCDLTPMMTTAMKS